MHPVRAQFAAGERIEHAVFNDQKLDAAGVEKRTHLLDVAGRLAAKSHALVIGGGLENYEPGAGDNGGFEPRQHVGSGIAGNSGIVHVGIDTLGLEQHLQLRGIRLSGRNTPAVRVAGAEGNDGQAIGLRARRSQPDRHRRR